MLLTIDIGNSATDFAVYDGQKMKLRSWWATDPSASPDGHGIHLHSVMEKKGIKPQQISSVILCNVVPRLSAVLRVMCADYFSCEPIWAEDLLEKYAATAAIKNPKEAGCDRRVNAYAAAVFYDAPAIVIDFGTATTFDLVTAEGAYGGGLISPGVDVGLEALHRRAARLPRVEIIRPKKVVGTTTFEAISAGIFWGHVAAAEGLVNKIRKEHSLAEDCMVIATGGFAPLFESGIEAVTVTDTDLTMKGLLSLRLKDRA